VRTNAGQGPKVTTQVMSRRIQSRGKRRRLNLFARLELRLCKNRVVDGLWIGNWDDEFELILRRVEEALGLIRRYDQLRYNRLICDLERIWVRLIPYGIGNFNKTTNTCELDKRFVLATSSSTEQIASVIVHEATHARLARTGIAYAEDLRARVEVLCLSQELAFAAKLPNGAELREVVQRDIKAYSAPEFWADEPFSARYIEGCIEALHYLGAPAPRAVVQFALRVRNLRLSIARLFRRH
jgi:hypothetical protein